MQQTQTANAKPVLNATLLAISMLRASSTNPRQTFDKQALADLTASVKAHGVIEPIIVRPVAKKKGEFEIVAGERRFRAAQAAGLDTVPAVVRELSDAETLEVQIVENLQRADLHPLEEAEGFSRLRDIGKHTVDAIATKLGKPAGYVQRRLHLLNLSEPCRKAYRGNEMTLQVAFMVSRLDATQQGEAWKKIKQWGCGLDPMRVADIMRREYMIDLEQRATFPIKDATLLAKAGSCTDCPKRTGNASTLYLEVERKDVCTDLACFEAKAQAHIARQTAEAKAKGIEVVTGNAAGQIIRYGRCSPESGYVMLDDKHYTDAKQRTFRQIAGKEAKVTLVHDAEHGKMVECMQIAGSVLAPLFSRSKRNDPESAKQKSEEKRRQQEQKVRAALLDKIAEAHTGSLPPNIAVVIAQRLLARLGSDDTKRLQRVWAPDDKPADIYSWGRSYGAQLAKLSSADLGRFMLQAALVGELYVPTYTKFGPSEVLETVAKELGVNPAAIRRGIVGEIVPAAPAKAAAKTATKAKAKR